jgi:hypothetical protein
MAYRENRPNFKTDRIEARVSFIYTDERAEKLRAGRQPENGPSQRWGYNNFIDYEAPGDGHVWRFTFGAYCMPGEESTVQAWAIENMQIMAWKEGLTDLKHVRVEQTRELGEDYRQKVTENITPEINAGIAAFRAMHPDLYPDS